MLSASAYKSFLQNGLKRELLSPGRSSHQRPGRVKERWRGRGEPHGWNARIKKTDIPKTSDFHGRMQRIKHLQAGRSSLSPPGITEIEETDEENFGVSSQPDMPDPSMGMAPVLSEPSYSQQVFCKQEQIPRFNIFADEGFR